jgi:hypothetical protein
MTLKKPDRAILIAHNRRKAKEAIEQCAWLIENHQWLLALKRL